MTDEATRGQPTDSRTRLRNYTTQALGATREAGAALVDAPLPGEARSAADIERLLKHARTALDNAFIVYGEWTAKDE